MFDIVNFPFLDSFVLNVPQTDCQEQERNGNGHNAE